MRKIILLFGACILLFNASVPLNADESKKPSDNLSFVLMSDGEYTEDYTKFKDNWYTQDFVNSLNRGLEFKLKKNYELIELSDIKINEAYRDDVLFFPLTNDFLNSKEEFLKEYNRSKNFTWRIPLKDKKNQYEFLKIKCNPNASDISKMAPEAFVSRKPFDKKNNNITYNYSIQYKDKIIEFVDKNKLSIKEGSKAYLVATYECGNVCFIISDKIDYVIIIDGMDYEYHSKQDNNEYDKSRYMPTDLSIEEVKKVNTITNLNYALVTVNDIKLMCNAYRKCDLNKINYLRSKLVDNLPEPVESVAAGESVSK